MKHLSRVPTSLAPLRPASAAGGLSARALLVPALLLASLALAACASRGSVPERRPVYADPLPASSPRPGDASGGASSGIAATSSPRSADAPAKPAKALAKHSITDWPERPRLAAVAMQAQYGPPQVVSSEKLVWKKAGPFKRIAVLREEIPHDFPKPHTDFLVHTVDYRVPADKVAEVLAFDGSVLIDRTAGELSARCDLESHNVLTLNIVHAIARGELDSAAARETFAQAIVDESLGKEPAAIAALQFEPQGSATADADSAVIPGAPRRATAGVVEAASGRAGDAGEALGYLIAVNDTEIAAALLAQKKQLSEGARGYAKLLLEEHGKSNQDTMALAQRLGIQPLDTKPVDQVRTKAAGELAAIAARDAADFEKRFLELMVKGHEHALSLIDDKLIPAATNDEVKQHFEVARGHVAHHLEEAKRLLGTAPGP